LRDVILKLGEGLNQTKLFGPKKKKKKKITTTGFAIKLVCLSVCEHLLHRGMINFMV
jgi:hypothetical protein